MLSKKRFNESENKLSIKRVQKISNKILEFSSILHNNVDRKEIKKEDIQKLNQMLNVKIFKTMNFSENNNFKGFYNSDFYTDQKTAENFYEHDIKIDPRKIIMGSLQNTVFISVITALSETSINLLQLINRLDLERRDLQPNFLYCVYLNVNGTWQEIFSDALLPFKHEKNERVNPENQKKINFFYSYYDSPPENWLGIVEKSYAIAYKSYKFLHIGLIEDYLYDLTGSHVETYSVKTMNSNQLANTLLDFFNKGFPIILLQNDFNDRIRDLYELKDNIGIYGCPVCDVRNTKTEFVLVKIRLMNIQPKNFTYLKNSPDWPRDLKVELAVNSDNSDVCWLSIEEIKNLFVNIVVTELNEKNLHHGFLFKFDGEKFARDKCSFGGCYIECEDKFDMSSTICQDDFRLRGFFDPKYRYKEVRLFIAKIKKNYGVKYIKSNIGRMRNVSLSENFEKGKYIIYFEIDWEDEFLANRWVKLNFTYKSNSAVRFFRLDDNKFNRADFLSNLYFDLIFLSYKAKKKLIVSTKIISENLEVKYGEFMNYFFIFVNNLNLINVLHTGYLDLPIMGCYFKDLSLSIKDFSDKKIDLAIPPDENIYFLFRILQRNPGEEIIPTIELENKSNFVLANYNILNKFKYEECIIDSPSPKKFEDYLDSEEEEKQIDNALEKSLDSDIKDQILNLDKLNQRKKDNELVQIRSGLLANMFGLNYLIINETENMNYNEILYFTLRNLELGKKISKKNFKISKNSCEISLNPKEYIVLRFYAKHINSSFSYNFKLKYQIKETSIDI